MILFGVKYFLEYAIIVLSLYIKKHSPKMKDYIVPMVPILSSYIGGSFGFNFLNLFQIIL